MWAHICPISLQSHNILVRPIFRYFVISLSLGIPLALKIITVQRKTVTMEYKYM